MANNEKNLNQNQVKSFSSSESKGYTAKKGINTSANLSKGSNASSLSSSTRMEDFDQALDTLKSGMGSVTEFIQKRPVWILAAAGIVGAGIAMAVYAKNKSEV